MKLKGKRVWETILSLLLVIPLITMNPVKAENVAHKVFELSGPEQANVGDIIDVNLKVYPKDDLASFQLSINYDTNAFAFQSGKAGVGSLGASVEFKGHSNGKIKVASATGLGYEENINDAIFLTLKMKVLEKKEAIGIQNFDLEVEKAYKTNKNPIDMTTEVKNIKLKIDAPLKGISLDKTDIEMNKGESQLLAVNKVPEFTTNTDKIQWSSADESIATVDQNGKVTAHKGGKTQITASVGSFKAMCDVTVRIPLESLSITEIKEAIDVGSQKQLSVTYLPEDTTVNKTVTWKSMDTSIATVDQNGIVKALKKGTVAIEATMAGKTTKTEIKVRQPLKEINIKDGDFELIKNKEKALEVIENPSEHDDKIDKRTWESSDTTIATVDQNGKVKALKEGTAVVSVVYSIGNKEVKSSVKVTVKEIHINKVTLNQTELDLTKGDKDSLTASFAPGDTTDDTTVSWTSSNTNVVRVENGHIEAIGGGTATVTATIAGVKATCYVIVNVPLESITIAAIANVIDVNGTQKLTVQYNPTDTTIEKTIQWKSSNNTIATVDKDGVVKALTKGKVTITATVQDKSATIELTIKQRLEKIEIEQKDFSLIKNETQKLTVKQNPIQHDDTITKKEWKSSDSRIVSVDQNGNVKALKEGKATISAIYYVGEKQYEAKVQVTVKEIHINKVTLNKTKVNLDKGDTDTLIVSYTPENATDDTTIQWSSSNTNVVKVENGNIMAVGGGSAIVTATIAGVKAECTINVRVPLMGITLTGSKEVLKGQTVSLTMKKVPSDATEELSRLEYQSSNTKIAKVDKDGKVTGVKEGTVDITVSGYVGERYYEAKHTITVKEIKLLSIQIDLDSSRIVLYTTKQAKVVYNPDNTTDDKSVVWSSSDPKVATVDQDGNIKGIKPGKTTITVTSQFNDQFKDEIEVEIYEIPMESIQLDKTSLELTVDDTYQCKATVLPENTTDSKKLSWKSSDETIATVDKNGKIKALKKGNATITVSAKDGEIKSVLKLKVVNKVLKPSYEVESKDIAISVPQNQLQDVYQSIPEDFKAIVADGGKLEVVVKSEVIENKETLNQLNTQLTKQDVLKDYHIGKWLSIDIYAEVTSFEGDTQSTLLSNLSKPLKIKVEIPQELLANHREYSIVRIHDGKAEVLKTELSADHKYLTFESDKYSEFAIVYKDVKVKEDQSQKDKTVSTSDTTIIGFELMGMVVSGAVIALSYKKKKYL